MTWCRLTVDVDVEFDPGKPQAFQIAGEEVAMALLRVERFKRIESPDLRPVQEPVPTRPGLKQDDGVISTYNWPPGVSPQ